MSTVHEEHEDAITKEEMEGTASAPSAPRNACECTQLVHHGGC